MTCRESVTDTVLKREVFRPDPLNLLGGNLH